MKELTPVQEKVLSLIAGGLRNRDIARELGVTTSAVENTIYRLYERLGVNTRLMAARWYWENRQPEAAA